MTTLIRFERVGDSLHVNFGVNVWLGEIYQEVDGFYVFWPNHDRAGYWSQWMLRAISDKLAELNKAWSEEIENHFSKPRPEGLEENGDDGHCAGLDGAVC